MAANLLRLRTVLGLSTVRLSALLAESGQPIPATGITRIEKGQRRVDTDDLMALASILGVNPSALLLPDTAKGSVELTGVGTVEAKTAWQWADGMRPLCIPEGDDGTARVDFQRKARPPGLRRYGLHGPGRQALMDEYGGAPIQRRKDGSLFREWPDGRTEDFNPDDYNDDHGEQR